MKKIVTEFKDFISRGNVMDMAVGVIVGGAFGKITSSLVNDVFMPFLGWVIGDIDLTALNITLSPAVMEGDTVVKPWWWASAASWPPSSTFCSSRWWCSCL